MAIVGMMDRSITLHDGWRAIAMKIRLFEAQDAEQIAQLFHDTIREVNVRDYSVNQVKAWAPDDIHFRNWVEVCSNRFTYVAEDEGVIAGFGELEADGHIDCFYCHKNYIGRGVGRQIYQTIEAKAVELGLSRLFVEASITAKPFFERMGFSVVKEQQVSRGGETFINYAMEKFL
ncbi:GNAT family N-acetyltransferase [Leptolyngbya sp. PL-A3]|nr:GNAT family N-acetyltransferase [Leptolyngbya sp. FACHB-8]